MFHNCDKMIVLTILLYFAHSTQGKIYTLNDTEYRKMPTMYTLDDFQDCLLEPGGTFCMVELDLFADRNSSLMKMIQGYTDITSKHFNHTRLHKGVCVTQTCKLYINDRNLRNKDEVTSVLDACLNSSIWDQYKLQATVSKLKNCKREGDRVTLDVSDYVFAIVVLALIVINVVGTFHDILRNEDDKGNPYLMSFSIVNNWKKLVAPAGVGPEPRLNRLKLFNGLRAMTMVCVVLAHTSLVLCFSFVKNPQYLERAYDDFSKQLLFNGTLVVFTFFVMSGFLLAFNFELHVEKHGVHWLEFPRSIALRWLRLTPSYALILGLISTLVRWMGSGPLWDDLVTAESKDCRRYWWAHILYVNNYASTDSQCLLQTWYLAADTQLFVIGLFFCILVRKPLARKITFGVMMLVSLLIPALHTYFQDLDAFVLQSPETMKSLYRYDRTFKAVYIPGHTNIASYTLGIAGGVLTYRWLTEGKLEAQFKKFRYIVWLIFPFDVLVILSGAMFYVDERPSLTMRVVYAALYKPVFQLGITFFIIACIFKSENVYRRIVEWRGFTWLGRISYSAFLLHSVVQRCLVGTFTSPIYLTDYYLIIILCASLFISFLLGGVLWLCLETPVKEFTKAVTSPKRRVQDTKI